MKTQDIELENAIKQNILRYPSEITPYQDYFDMLRNADNHKAGSWLRDELSKNIRKCANNAENMQNIPKMGELYQKSIKYDAPFNFDAYLIHMEKNRELKNKFYAARRPVLKHIVKNLQALEDNELDLYCISMPPGTGKALANDTQILTKSGWKKHGDIIVGDYVIGIDGEYKRVTHVHPKCMLDQLVTFSNGQQFICHKRHEWPVYNRHKNKAEILETQSIIGIETNIEGRGHRYHYQAMLREPIKGEYKELPVKPYTLGAWLGDGTNCSARITTPDIQVIDGIVEDGYIVTAKHLQQDNKSSHYDFGWSLRPALQSIGMCHIRKTLPKHIPEEYITASIEQRLSLLAGLIDTDGGTSGNRYHFSTTDENILDGIIKLIYSFGWKCSITTYQPSISSYGIQGTKVCYTIGFNPTFAIPCRVPRKKTINFSKQRRIGLKSIETISPVEGNCITVEDGIYLAGITMIPTHNTTLALFYLSWLAGRHPENPILAASHSAAIVHGMYGETLRFIQDEEYTFAEIFPQCHIANTDAKNLMIDIDKSKRFSTLSFRSIEGGNAGLVRAETLLYCDDLIPSLEVALSKDRLDTTWGRYTVDLKQRKIGKCRELHIATRWANGDIIGRLENTYKDEPRAKFDVIPALDENGESNFKYPGIEQSFSTKFYENIRETMDDVSFRCLYMGDPIEREGLLYPEDSLRRYDELPPKNDCSGIIGIYDTKNRGSDSAFMPLAWCYHDDYYIDDCICDDGLPETVDPRVIQKLIEYDVSKLRVESNAAGGRIADNIQKELKEIGRSTEVSQQFTTANKETKILLAESWVKQRCLFRRNYPKSGDYARMMKLLTTYAVSAKNKHDDVPDGMAMLKDFALSLQHSSVIVMCRPF